MVVALILGCTPGLPSVEGVAGTSPSPAVPWTPPARTAEDTVPPAPPALPPDLAERAMHLTLSDVVDLGLRNNPATQASWASARAAAALYGAEKGAYYPSVDASFTGTRLKTVASQGRSAVEQTTYGPGVTLSWLLLDFGGRSGTIAGAREGLIAADWSHNATVQNVVLQVQTSFFGYMATRALLDAQRESLKEAQANLDAAQQRHDVGLGTIADVLQAKTALSQAQLDALTTEGGLATARGALALSMGLPANLPFEVDSLVGQPPVTTVADSVDSLIARAVRDRPDLAAAEAEARQSETAITAARGARLPSLVLNGNTGYTAIAGAVPFRNSYSISLGVAIPLFNGFNREYTQRAAEERASAARAGAQSLRQQVVFQVFTSYFTLKTATQRVQTTDDLLESADRSAQVALGRYREGVGNVIDLLTAESALAAARAQQVQARWEWQAALVQLAHDVGSLDERGQAGIRLVSDSTEAESQ